MPKVGERPRKAFRGADPPATKVLAFALAFVLLSPLGSARANHGDNGRSISGGCPYGVTCGLAARAFGDSNMEVEPHLAVNPTNPNNIAVAWAQDCADGIAAGIVVGVSHDGGHTWEKSIPPMTSLCSGGNYKWAFKAHLSFGPEGHLYLRTEGKDSDARARVTVQVLLDGGDTWSQPVVLDEAYGPSLAWSWVAADPNPMRAGTVYAAWFRAYYTDAFNSAPGLDMRFARSTDGGATWSAPRDISPAPIGYDRAFPDNTIGVLFYDFRNDVPDDDEATTDVWFISSLAGSEGPWEERHVAGPFDVNSVPSHIGSNQGIAGVPDGFAAAYTVVRPLSTRGQTDIFFSRLPNNEI